MRCITLALALAAGGGVFVSSSYSFSSYKSTHSLSLNLHNNNNNNNNNNNLLHHSSFHPSHSSSSPSLHFSGICQATQTQLADSVPSILPKVQVREARLDDCWEVVETHCSSFFPEFSFPLDFVLRLDRLVAMLFGLSVPSGCKRTCLVAVTSCSTNTFYFQSDVFNFGGFDPKLPLNRGHVAGILTVDTVADFLPRKGPLRQRRTGIAYISNVAVREKFRRKGIAKRLIAKAEAQAWSWGCHAVALHCDLKNPGATNLYKSLGFKSIKVPEGANWPQPKTSPDMQFNFMMKLVRAPATL